MMGGSQLKVIVVPRRATWALLALVSLLMVCLVYLLSGIAYASDAHPVRELLTRVLGSRRGPISRDALLAFLMPVVANVLLFVPWGFLAFLAIDAPRRSRPVSYTVTVVAALLFALAMYVWQQFLPTRVTTVFDGLSNGAGALAGAALAHVRKSIYVRFGS